MKPKPISNNSTVFELAWSPFLQKISFHPATGIGSQIIGVPFISNPGILASAFLFFRCCGYIFGLSSGEKSSPP